MCVKITLKFEAWKKSKWPSSLNLISFVHIWLDLKCEEQAKDDEMKKMQVIPRYSMFTREDSVFHCSK